MIGDRPVTVRDMTELRFTTRVINESMRLYPQPPVLIRWVTWVTRRRFLSEHLDPWATIECEVQIESCPPLSPTVPHM